MHEVSPERRTRALKRVQLFLDDLAAIVDLAAARKRFDAVVAETVRLLFGGINRGLISLSSSRAAKRPNFQAPRVGEP